MRYNEQGPAWRLVRAPGFHTHQAVFDNVHAPHAVGCGDFVELIEEGERTEFPAIYGNGSSSFELYLYRHRLVRSFRWRNDPLPHGFLWRVRRILEDASLVAQVPNIAVAAVDVLCGLFDRNIVLAGIRDRLFSRVDLPFTPRGNDGEFGCQRFRSQFEAHLIVALAGATMGDGVSTDFFRDLNLPFCEQR